MSLFKKRFPTLEEQISRLSPKCRELTDEESRLVNGGGPSVWDTYNGTGCPYEYTTVPKDPPAETTTPTTSTPANKTTEIAESTATDTANQSDNNSATNSQDFSHSSGTFYSDSKTEKTNPIYFTRACDAAIIAEKKGKREINWKQETRPANSVWNYYNERSGSNPYKKKTIQRDKSISGTKNPYEGIKTVNFADPTESKRITSLMGIRTDAKPFNHMGIDIGPKVKGVKGDPILSIADGIVVRNGITEQSNSSRLEITIPGSSNTVVYQHADFLDLAPGTMVKKRDVLGTMSDLGCAGNIHLHLEFRKNGTYTENIYDAINPLHYLSSDYKVEGWPK